MSLPRPQARPATYADILAAPEGVTAEVIDGVLHTQPRPLPRHGLVEFHLSGLLAGGPARPNGGWWILPEVEVSLTGSVVVPDIAGWRRSTRLDFPGERPIETVPDWTCEIASPSTEARDRVRKADLYARAGVGHYWIVNPATRTLEAFERRDGGWLRVGAWEGEASAAIAPFAELEIALGRLWPPEPTDEP